MGALDTATEVELIVCLALTNPRMVGMKGGTLVPLTGEARAAVGAFTNPVDEQQHYYELTPEGLDRWVNDAMVVRNQGTTGKLPLEMLRSLKEQCNTRMQSLIIPEGSPRGLLLDAHRVIDTWDKVWAIAVLEHKLSWKVVQRLSVGVWTGETRADGNETASLPVAEPNITIRLTPQPGKEQQPVGRRIIEQIANVLRAALLQDAVGLRARTAGGEWWFLLVPDDLDGQSEKSVALFSGTRSAAERMVEKIPQVLEDRLPAKAFTFEIRPLEREGGEASHVLIARHAGSNALRELLRGLFETYAQLNLVVDPINGTERDFFLPVAHNCPEDLLAYDDLRCDDSAGTCRRWNVRYRFVSAGTTPLSVRDCHCDDRAHPYVAIDRTPDGSECVQVRLDYCARKACNHSRQGIMWFVPVRPEGNNKLTREWLIENWALGWLDDI